MECAEGQLRSVDADIQVFMEWQVGRELMAGAYSGILQEKVDELVVGCRKSVQNIQGTVTK
eukprot:6023680-Karenia_brevis.AAC.1